MSEKDTKNRLSVAAITISIAAFLTSAGSYVVARDSHQLGLQQYQDSFLTIWKCEYISENEVFKFSPTNNDVVLQRALAYYPSEISDSEWPIRPPDRYLHVTVPKFSIQQIIKANHPPIVDVGQVLEGSVPLVVEAYYTVNGKNWHDKSIYMLEYSTIITDEPNHLPNIVFEGMVFGKRLQLDTDVRLYLNKMWEKREAPDRP